MGAEGSLTQEQDGTMVEASWGPSWATAMPRSSTGQGPQWFYKPSKQLARLALAPRPLPTPLRPPTCGRESSPSPQGGPENEGIPSDNQVTLPSGTSQESVQVQSRPACPVGDRMQASYTPHPCDSPAQDQVV